MLMIGRISLPAHTLAAQAKRFDDKCKRPAPTGKDLVNAIRDNHGSSK